MSDFVLEVRVELKKGALDAEGETVAKSLNLLGYKVKKVDTLKVYRITVDAKDEESAVKTVSEASKRLLANPVIQDFEVTVV
ncbi:MAG: phosphoribosylformylglycinamidine synthase subunit PurS [Candidatus Altiarchaeota archaeon]|nr:phosphoribosylformylglycinamidine synthase subunit PurS [Candidatus Altiarchaeota archaeon]